MPADESGPRNEYFRAVEEHFVRLRGAPLLLSPTDWKVAEGWFRQGVPLEVVEETLEGLFAQRRERGTKGRVNSLRYCAPAVEAAWSRLQEIRGPDSPPPIRRRDPKVQLDELAAALPADLPDREQWQARIVGLEGPVRAIDEGLRLLDEELMRSAEQRLSTAERTRLEEAVDAAMSRVEARVPPGERAALRTQLRRQRLREVLALPLLTVL